MATLVDSTEQLPTALAERIYATNALREAALDFVDERNYENAEKLVKAALAFRLIDGDDSICGWVCPLCGAANAPSVQRCPCVPPVQTT
jgi:hypothetical protein